MRGVEPPATYHRLAAPPESPALSVVTLKSAAVLTVRVHCCDAYNPLCPYSRIAWYGVVATDSIPMIAA